MRGSITIATPRSTRPRRRISNTSWVRVSSRLYSTRTRPPAESRARDSAPRAAERPGSETPLASSHSVRRGLPVARAAAGLAAGTRFAAGKDVPGPNARWRACSNRAWLVGGTWRRAAGMACTDGGETGWLAKPCDRSASRSPSGPDSPAGAAGVSGAREAPKPATAGQRGGAETGRTADSGSRSTASGSGLRLA